MVNRTYRMTVSMDRGIKDDLEWVARRMGISKTDVIRMGIYRFIEEKRGMMPAVQASTTERTHLADDVQNVK